MTFTEISVRPTNAAMETVTLADRALWFLDERADYWKQQSVPVPPASALGMRLSRTRTFCNTGESGMDRTSTSVLERPFSADDATRNMNTAKHGRRSKPQNKDKDLATTENNTPERLPPIGRSAEPPNVDNNTESEHDDSGQVKCKDMSETKWALEKTSDIKYSHDNAADVTLPDK